MTVTAETVLPLIAAPACVIYLTMTRRAVRTMRSGDEEWRDRWRAIDPARREAIRERMKRGEAVPDLEDAELAIRAVAQLDHVLVAMRPITYAGLLTVLAFLVVGLLANQVMLTIVGAVGIASSAALHLWSGRQRMRYRRSVAATRRAHEISGPLST